MTWGGRTLILIAGSFLLGTGSPVLLAEVAGNPYQGIVDRNLFNLRPPTRPEDNLPPAQPPPQITLTGITTILGNKRVLMKVQEPPHPPQPAKEDSYILTEGQRDGDIEVLSIDEQAGSVKVNNHGTIQELTFEKNGARLPSTRPLPGIPPRGNSPLIRQIPRRGPVPDPRSSYRDRERERQQNTREFRPPQVPRTMPGRTLRLPPLPGGQGARTIPGSPPGAE